MKSRVQREESAQTRHDYWHRKCKVNRKGRGKVKLILRDTWLFSNRVRRILAEVREANNTGE